MKSLTEEASTQLPIAQSDIDASQNMDQKQPKRREKRKLSRGSSEDQQKTKPKKAKENVQGEYVHLIPFFD